ncbi:MAG: class A beta-lactamase-related serine hydrolase [Bacteroidota bacterium]|nr:class A beta-lactamase-related serine hydrolase [Bacteroidota bacterium]
MTILRLFLVLSTLIWMYSCTSSRKISEVIPVVKMDTISAKIKDTAATVLKVEIDDAKTDSMLENILKSYPGDFDSILKNRKQWNVQIIYTQINRDKNNVPTFKDFFFNIDSLKYFYPASVVKMPVAMLALQKLNELAGTSIRKSTSMITEAGYAGQTATYNDPQTADGRPTIESDIKRIFLVSDNEAFNRLYEFLGQEYINEELHKKGFKDVEILHRLNIFLSEDENRHTNPIKFMDGNNKIIYSQPLTFNEAFFSKRNDSVGQAFVTGNKIVEMPMDFSKKNRISLQDLHYILRSAIFPADVAEDRKFNLIDSDYVFLHQYMSEFPSESIYPSYDSTNFPDAYGKFLLYGSTKNPLPKNIRIFNKVGDAYGQLTDVAYITDFDKNIEFFLSATIYCNADGIINDDKYDYDTIGLPFMKNVGQALYNFEVARKRTYPPDLSSFKLTYDK